MITALLMCDTPAAVKGLYGCTEKSVPYVNREVYF